MIEIAHLNNAASYEPFVISSATFARLAAASHFSLEGDYLLLGIRAAKLVEGEYGRWHDSVAIVEHCVDGENLRCLLGIWDRRHHKVAFFPASTVPNVVWQQKQIDSPDKAIANALGVGLYNYIVGAHEPNGEGRAPEEGAFRLSRLQPVLAWRFYQPDHQFSAQHATPTLSVVNDHIHSAQTTTQPEGASFSSAGCQVIEGDHQPPNIPTGYYQIFRVLAGQSAMPSPLEVGLKYQYLLSHVRQLEQIVHGEEAISLMQGSRGMLVRRLQEALMEQGFLDEDNIDKGDFNGFTALALYQYQKATGIVANALATTSVLKHLKITPLY